MSIKAKAPKVDPETKARQAQAEARAEASRIEATQEQVSEETRAVIRQFGRIAALSGSSPSLAPMGSFQSGLIQSAAAFGGSGFASGGRSLARMQAF